jgi:hypothetical protein
VRLSFADVPTQLAAGVEIMPGITVEILGSEGQRIPDAVLSISLAAGGGPSPATLRGRTTVTSTGGVAVFSGVSMVGLGSGYFLIASAPGVAPDTSGVFAISPGTSATITFAVAPSSVAAGRSFPSPLQVMVRDSFGNGVDSYADSVELSIDSNVASGTLVGQVRQPVSAGVAEFRSIAIDNPGAGYRLAARLGALAVRSDPFDVTARLVFLVQPRDVEAGVALTPAVSAAIVDDSSRTISSASNAIDLALTGYFYGERTTRLGAPAVQGVATFSGLTFSSTALGARLVASGSALAPDSTAPFPISLPLVAVFGGGRHSCGVTADGRTACWGSDNNGALGDGYGGPGTPVSLVPGLIDSPLALQSLAVGVGHTCGFDFSGSAYCWGLNVDGQLGIGGSGGVRVRPVAVLGALRFFLLTAGADHTCGLALDSLAYCWGSNLGGQLGTGGEPTASATPVPVAGSFRFGAIAAGQWYTCALTADGAAYCWGYNGEGELGDGSRVSRSTPTPVAGGHSFVQLAVGYSHACGLITTLEVLCWGTNTQGELGNPGFLQSDTAVAVAGGSLFRSVTAGQGFTCGISPADEGYCWGSNTWGEQGVGSLTPPSNATPTPVSGGLTWRMLSAGESHVCGVTLSGVVYCWGSNVAGTAGIGNPDPISVTAPARVVH